MSLFRTVKVRALVLLFGLMAFWLWFPSISHTKPRVDWDLMKEALESIAAAKADLGMRSDLYSHARMNRFARWISAPPAAPEEAQTDARRLFASAQNPGEWLEEMGQLSEIRDIAPLPVLPHEYPGVTDDLPRDLFYCIKPLLMAMHAANQKLEETMAVRDEHSYEHLITYLLQPVAPAADASEAVIEVLPMGREVNLLIDQASQVDQTAILCAGLTLLRAVFEAKTALSRCMDQWNTLATETIDSPLGKVVIGGPGPDVHQGNAALIIDVGGDDIYRGRVASGRDGNCSVVLDLRGDDLYAGEGFTQGSGVRGIGILWDAGGDDVYQAGNVSQGAGLLGMGLLVDEAGNDRYSGEGFVQAAAAWGWGGLLDSGGEDRYECRNSGQAFSGVNGTAVLTDVSGNDKYLAGAATPDHRDETMNQSFAQGFAAGMRDLAGGGYALVADQWGNDLYECQYFGQGAGYYMGVGVLYDQDGKDTYAARRYAQGAGIHYAFGLLLDAGGDDRYVSWGVSQGCGHDYGIGFLMDARGNDVYAADCLSMGASKANGAGIFIDNGGDDRYGALFDMPVGRLSKGRRSGGIGLFVDAGGKDAYTREGADDTLWGQNRFSAGIDRNQGGFSGVRILQNRENPPQNPEAEQRTRAEARRLSRLLTDGEDLSGSQDMLRLLTAASSRGLEKEIPKRAGKLLFRMDPHRSLPLIVDILDEANVSVLAFLNRLFMRHAFCAVSVLIRETKGKNDRFEARRCYYLGVLRDTRALPVCLKRLSHPSWKVRAAALRAVGDMLDQGRLKNLIPMKEALKAAVNADSPGPIDGYLRADAKRCEMLLSVLTRALPLSATSYEALSAQCNEKKGNAGNRPLAPMVFENASLVLSLLDGWMETIRESGEIARQFMPCLTHPDPEVRRAAAYGLGQMRYAPAVSPLLDLLNDPEMWVRDAAVLSLVLFGDDAVGPLAERMAREGPPFRILAIDALSRMDTPRARAQIIPYMDDLNAHVRRAAKQGVVSPDGSECLSETF